MTQLDFLHTGLQLVVVDSITPEIYVASSAGEVDYLHTWNELNSDDLWYGTNSTWTDTGKKGYMTLTGDFSEKQSLLYDIYIYPPTYEIDNYPQHTAIEN